MDRSDRIISRAEWFRLNPSEFITLPVHEKLAHLDKICGLGKFVFKFDESLPADNHYDRAKRDCVSNALVAGDWNIAAKTMFFFRMRVHPFGNFNNDASLLNFIEHFPFGCMFVAFEKSLYVNAYNLACWWCSGRMDIPLVHEIIFNINDVMFQHVLNELSKMKYKRCDLVTMICNLKNFAFSDGTKLVDPKSRRGERPAIRMSFLLDVLSQLITVPTGHHYDEIVYPCMMVYSYDKEVYKKAVPMKRPVWNRQRHLQLKDPVFQAAVMTILLMQKFRQVDFPLAKDLLTMIIGFTFDAHVVWMEENMRKRAMEIECWKMKYRYEEEMVFDIALNLGIPLQSDAIVIYNWSKIMADLHDLNRGVQIPGERVSKYRTIIRDQLNLGYRNSLYPRLDPQIQEWYFKDEGVIYDGLMTWAEKKQIPMAKIYRRTYELTDADVDEISVAILQIS